MSVAPETTWAFVSSRPSRSIANAAALLADRPILLLDEATSSLDAASERQVAQALERLARGRGYAEQGHVDAITVTPGLVLAYVRGSRARPYRVQVRLRTLGEEVLIEQGQLVVIWLPNGCTLQLQAR